MMGPHLAWLRLRAGLSPGRAAIALLPVALVLSLGMARRASASSIDPNQIRRVVKKHRRQIVRCYEAAAELPKGKLVVRFVIGATGAVRRADVDSGSTLEAPEVEACVLAEIRKWRFPPLASGDEITIIYPFILDGTGW
jgi:outer membrane biosynthesis protein TonB